MGHEQHNRPPKAATLARLQDIMARLRDPKHGCPWDQQQTFETIAPYTLEEAYEVADAIERKDMADLREELGDLLFQVVFHAQMADEARAFDLHNVITGICDKMERRHPHVFGTKAQIAAGVQSGDWERHKAEERGQNPAAKEASGIRAGIQAGMLDGVARALPALVRAQKLQQRAARAGFDWDSADPVFAKLDEEINELKAAIQKPEHAQHVQEEMGDILFACTNLARHLGLDAQSALRAANAKFERRFGMIEEALRLEGRSPQEANLGQMESLWEQAKAQERANIQKESDID